MFGVLALASIFSKEGRPLNEAVAPGKIDLWFRVAGLQCKGLVRGFGIYAPRFRGHFPGLGF